MRTFYYTFAMVLFLILSSNVLAQQSSVKPGETTHYVVDAAWPKKPERFKWAQMAGIAVDKQDHIYLFTRSQPTVQVYKTDGTMVRDYLYVQDAVNAYLMLAERLDEPRVSGEAFNFGMDNPKSVLEIVQTIIAVSDCRGNR